MQAKLSIITFACALTMSSPALAQFTVTSSTVWDASVPLTLASDLLDNLAPGTRSQLHLSDQKGWAPLLQVPAALPTRGTLGLTALRAPSLSALIGVGLAELPTVDRGELERHIALGNMFPVNRSARGDERLKGRDLLGQVVRPWLSLDDTARREWRRGAGW